MSSSCKIDFLVLLILTFTISLLSPPKTFAYTNPIDCTVNVQCDSSQCSSSNDRYCTGFFPDETACTYHESCTVTGNPSCNCSGLVGNYTYTFGECSQGSTCTGILGSNGSSTICKYCQTPLCTPGETDTLGCTPPAGCTASRTCTANYEWGACSTTCTCTNPDPSTISCGSSYIPIDCSNPQIVTGTSCPADEVCSNNICKPLCPAGQSIAGSVYSCQDGSACPSLYTQDTSYSCAASQVCCKKDACPVGPQGSLTYSCRDACTGTGVYTSYTKACVSPKVCCYQGNTPPPATTDAPTTTTSTTTSTATFKCDGIWAQQPQTCTSGDCNVNLGANYSGSRTSPIQQCWSKDGVSWGCNTDSQATSHAFPCGQTSQVTMTAKENFNSQTNTAGVQSTCPNASITPTCGSGPPPPPSLGPLVCFRGDTNCAITGMGYWHADGSGCLCHCAPGENYTTANIYDQQHLGGVCFQENTSQPPPPTPGNQGIVGSYWIKNTDGTLTKTPQPYQTGTLFPMFYWIYSPSGSYTAANGGYCGKLTTLNGDKICYQDAYYGVGNPDLAYWAVADPYSIGGNNQQLQLYSWPDGFKPIGFYTYQSVEAVEQRTDYRCIDTSCGTSGRPDCMDCGGTTCSSADGDCTTDTYDVRWGCVFNDGVGGHGARSYGSLGSLTKNQINTVTNFCAPDNGSYARVDLVFEKDPSPQACSMLLPTTSCNGTFPVINLSWTSSLNALSYDVYRSIDNGVTYSLLANVPTNQFANTNVTQNVTYYYKVTAKNTYGSKDCTPPVSAQAYTCDATPPNIFLSFTRSSSGCYDSKTWPANFEAAASVSPPSTVSTVTFTLTPVAPTVGSAQIYTGTLQSGSRNEGIWRPTTAIPKPNPGIYTIQATATTQSNISTSSTIDNLGVLLSCTSPWLETTGGDIYSGVSINLPAGPPQTP